jgi:hypothetical protein
VRQPRVVLAAAACAALLLFGCGGGTSGPREPGGGAVPGGGAGQGGTAPDPSACGADPRWLGGALACTAEAGGERMLRRLARFEYDNTIADLLGLQGQASERFAADTVVNGFSSNARALVVTPLLADQLYASAERLAAEATQNLGALVPCDPARGDTACAEAFVRGFGRRAFRRPLRDAEVARYSALYAQGSADGGFAAGVELVLTALLQSPNFLYRTELGQPSGARYALDPYELATELSYALTGSTPDESLLDAAERDELVTAAQIDLQAARLIDSPRGRAHLARFVREWLELDRLGSVPKDALLFPEFDAEVRAAMAAEVERYVEHVAFEGDGTLEALLTAPLAFVNAALARFYGVSLPRVLDAEGFGRVEMPDAQRRGLLALGAVMTTHARPDSSSPVHRGKLVRERVLCQHLQPPPPGIVVQPPPVDPALSVRERYAAHSAEQPCQGCHQLIDPLGFGFEHFDGVGRYRATDAGRAVDASGHIIASATTDGEFDGAAELAALLGGSEEVARCFAMQWMRFAYGVEESAELACALEALQDGFVRSGGDLRALMLATAQTAHFRVRLPGEPAPPGDPGAPSDPSGPPDPQSDPGDPPDDDPLTVTTRTDSMWPAGHCKTVMVHNAGSAPIEWRVVLAIEGTLTDHWNATATGDRGEVTFAGADWNRTVQPGATAEFGYCVSTGA